MDTTKLPGHSLIIKGHITASEDVTIAGRVEGSIAVPGHLLVIAPGAELAAEVDAASVRVAGALIGNVMASRRLEILQTGSVEGDVVAQRVAIADGAHVQGRVETSAPHEASSPA
jgi:cytoskeletal protein CcmA (bactofilin family)